MSDEQQYFNPIVAAIAHAQEINRQKAMDAETIKQHGLENKRLDLQQKVQQQLADLQSKRLDEEHQQHLDNIQYLADALAVQKNVMHTRDKQTMIENMQSGAAKPEAYQTPAQNVPDSVGLVAPGTGPGMVNPGGGAPSIPISSIGTPEEAQQRLLTIEARQQAIKDQSASNLETQRSNAQMDLEKERGRNHILGIQAMHSLGVTPGTEGDALAEADNAIKGIISAQTGVSSLQPDLKRAVNARAAQLGITLPTNQKQQSDNLQLIGDLDKYFDIITHAAQTQSRDSPTTTDDLSTKATKGITNLFHGLVSPVLPGSDAKTTLDLVKSSTGQLAVSLDKNKRGSEPEMLRQLNGVFDPARTMDQNLANIEAKKKQFEPIVKKTFSGIPPVMSNDVLTNLGVTHFNAGGLIPSQTQNNPNGQTLPKGVLPPGMPPPPVPVPGQNAPPISNAPPQNPQVQGATAPQPRIFLHVKGPDGQYKLVPAPLPGGGQ